MGDKRLLCIASSGLHGKGIESDKRGAEAQVRGSSAPAEELAFISQHSGAVGAVVHDAAALDKLVAGARAQVDAWGGTAGLVCVCVGAVVVWDAQRAPAPR